MTARRLMFVSILILFAVPAALASSTWYVDGVHGSDNHNCKSRQHACKTIGHAISLASSGDSIRVAAATYAENLTISISLRVIGSGAQTTIIDGRGVNTVVTISDANAHVTLSKLTIRNGSTQNDSGGGGVYNQGALTILNSIITGNTDNGFCGGRGCTSSGGGISSSGPLTISDSTISGNSSSISYCQSGCFASGGGISSSGPLTIRNSTISGNNSSTAYSSCRSRCVASGGGISSYGPLTISDSTISGNSAFTYPGPCQPNGCVSYGGGIWVSSGNMARISNSTVSANILNRKDRFGGGISAAATLQNSIVANNADGDCYGTMTSNGYNLSSDNTCNLNNTGDLNNTDPKLGTLGNYGGPTQTIPLLSGSPAIDAGNPKGCTDSQGHLLRTDQRGKPRHDREDTSGCDMGAYERQQD